MSDIKQEDSFAQYATGCGGDCGNPSHIMRFQFDRRMPDSVWVDLQPSISLPLRTRICISIKYILGIVPKTHCGYWQCAYIGKKSVEKTMDFLYKYQLYRAKWDQKNDDLSAEEANKIDEEMGERI